MFSLFFPTSGCSISGRKSNRPQHPLPECQELLVLLFGRVWWSRREVLVEAAPEEGERRVHHVVAALGGGDFVPLVWENLDGQEMGKTAGLSLCWSLFNLSDKLGQHNRAHFQAVFIIHHF